MRAVGRVGAAAVVLAIALVASSCEEDFGIELPTPAAIQVASGTDQEAAVGTDLPNPIVARVTASDGRPVAGISVDWEVTAGDGSLSATSSTTGGGGEAETTWSLGTVAGTQTVRATVPQMSGGATFDATALPGDPVSLSVSPTSVEFTALGETQALAISGQDAFDNPISEGGTWSSNNESVVSVSTDGVVTAEGNGSATVTVALGGRTAGASVSVQQAVAGLTLSSEAETLTESGATVQLSAALVDANGFDVTDASVSWTSLSPAIATVSSSGLVTAVAAGSTLIVAEAGQASDTAEVTVDLPSNPVASIVVTPTSLFFDALGATEVLAAEARDAGGQVVTGVSFAWSSTAGSVASVSSSGVVTAVGNGGATITASSGGVTSNDVSVTVEQATAELAVSPGFGALLAGASATMDVDAFDAGGSPIAAPVLSTLSRNELVAAVSGTQVTAIGTGVTDVVVTSDGASDSTRVAVVDANGFALLATTDATEALLEAGAGGTLELSLWLRRPPGGTGGLGSISGTLSWDPTVLTYQSSAGEATGFSWTANENNTATGELGFGSFAAEGIADSFVVARVTFTVTGSAGSGTALTLAVSAAGDAEGAVNIKDLIQVVDGRVEVTP